MPMRNRSRRPLRLKAGIAPIHVRELLNGAGMTGFLSVLDPPVFAPHLQEPERAESDSLLRVSARANTLLVQLRRQDEVLSAIIKIARRINNGAAKLQRQAETVQQIRASRFSLQERRTS